MQNTCQRSLWNYQQIVKEIVDLLTFNAGIKSLRANAAWPDFLLAILLFEPWILLIYAWKTNTCNNYSFSLLIMYAISYMFRDYIAIFRERS
jgi:hypothetical protein